MAKMCENGIYRDMTEEEIELYHPEEETPTAPELPDRMSALENAVAELVLMQIGGME